MSGKKFYILPFLIFTDGFDDDDNGGVLACVNVGLERMSASQAW